MRKIVLTGNTNTNYLRAHPGGARFILLGAAPTDTLSTMAFKKISGETRARDKDFWGTLGMANDSTPVWKGTIRFSERGNLQSTPGRSGAATVEEINHLHMGQSPEIASNERDGLVVERFISFRDVEFPDYPQYITNYNDIPKLRLTLMVDPGEGALVFYQHMERDRFPGSYKDTLVEYILPKPTRGNDCSERDRLTYHIPILPPHRLHKSSTGTYSLSQEKPKSNFVIKILTTKRKNSTSVEIISRLEAALFKTREQLLIWNQNSNMFVPCNASMLDFTKKTLFLLHGTFSDTDTAFKDLISGGRNSWLAGKTSTYPQIIGLDHLTISKGPDENVMELSAQLPLGAKFTPPLDILTHSRGGLVGKWMACNAPQLPVDKGALVACANGVGYFNTGGDVAKFLSIARMLFKGTGHPGLALISGLAQHSMEAFLKMPGCQAMTPGSPFLTSLLDTPPGACLPQYLFFAGDYDKSLSKQEGLMRRWAEFGLDWVIGKMLGYNHDWVVGTKEQRIVEPGYSALNRPSGWTNTFTARHWEYFGQDGTRDPLSAFLR